MKYAKFDTAELYKLKLNEINDYLGYPDGHGTDNYCDAEPTIIDVDGKFIMPVIQEIEDLFDSLCIAYIRYPMEEE